MQLTNNPAEELAKILVDSGKGAFAKCGFVSGGENFDHDSSESGGSDADGRH